jgi:hypothetical protein
LRLPFLVKPAAVKVMSCSPNASAMATQPSTRSFATLVRRSSQAATPPITRNTRCRFTK